MNTEHNKKIEDILGSLDHAGRAAAPDFFYTRLKARMERELTPDKARSWKLRPVYAFSALFLILMVNAAVIFTGNNSTDDNATASTDTDVSQSIASEYRINSNLTYEINQ